MRYLLLATMLILVPTAVSAHPDHLAGAPVGLLHHLSDPFHISMAAAGVLFLASIVGGLWRHRSASSRRAHL